jgi:ADP-ribosyl-[dinitrogen reductase] hydrolase
MHDTTHATEVEDRFRGCLLGLAVGDAVGTTVEFQPRGTFAPVTDLTGGGPFGLDAGQWTDDTSMALCLATSLLETGRFDPADQMRRYVRWWREGELSSTGRCFDIGTTVRAALTRFEQTGKPYAGSTDPYAAGNGAIMRLAPVPMFFLPDEEAAIARSAESARTTHGAAECVDACRLLGTMLACALQGGSKADILGACSPEAVRSASLKAIARGAYRTKRRPEVRGTGYVVPSLEAALWCFARAETFEEATLLAANLGDDADTTAAVCGQVAGAYHGASGIPARWLERLTWRAKIAAWADALRERRPAPQG